ncbi:MAG: DNA methyltransferase, partial [Bacteroidota bacterium]
FPCSNLNKYTLVDILDKIFGHNKFNSEIIWERSFGTGSSKSIAKKLPVNLDTIFYYTKEKEKYTYNLQTRPLNEGALKRYDKVDENGKRFFWADMKTYSKERLNDMLETGEAKWSENAKNPRYKKYLDESKGTPIDTLWNDFDFIGNKERIGYPTQKPEALMNRIIQMASNEGDLVLDPFAGGGTTIAVAEKLNRQWIGVDQSVQAIKVTEMRLNNQMDLFSKPFIVQLHKYDYDTLRFKDAFAFESFIITAFNARPNTKQRGDSGIDGKTLDNVPIQVKRSDNIGRNVIDNFHSAVQRFDKKLYEKNKKEKKPVGFIIAFTFGKGAIEEVARLHNKEDAIIKLVTVEEVVPIAKKPMLTVQLTDKGKDKKNLHEIFFKAAGTSEAGVEFYSWDFDFKEPIFKAEVLLDKAGEQTWKFKPGLHHIAVKVVDNDGLENVEVVRLKVNGEVERQ